MMEIFSKAEPLTLVASYISSEQISDYRNDLSPAGEYLQVSARNLKVDTKIKPHKHNLQDRTTDRTQEAWIVFSGKLKATLYDLDDSFLTEVILKPGDCIVLFKGGHGLEVLEDNTIFYEFKNGPYYGIDADKQSIGQ
jgi:cupin fold WbuC family metalloprotein